MPRFDPSRKLVRFRRFRCWELKSDALVTLNGIEKLDRRDRAADMVFVRTVSDRSLIGPSLPKDEAVIKESTP